VIWGLPVSDGWSVLTTFTACCLSWCHNMVVLFYSSQTILLCICATNSKFIVCHDAKVRYVTLPGTHRAVLRLPSSDVVHGVPGRSASTPRGYGVRHDHPSPGGHPPICQRAWRDAVMGSTQRKPSPAHRTPPHAPTRPRAVGWWSSGIGGCCGVAELRFPPAPAA
jgi:hypothetical protein